MLEVKKITKIFRNQKKSVIALHDVSFTIEKGDIFSLMGKSGSGKTTLAHLLMGFITPTTGEIFFNNELISGRKRDKKLALSMQIVFQDSLSSLNPKMCVEDLINEPLKIWGKENRVDELLDSVGLPHTLKKRRPSELSGGQRQRVSIARALSLNPPFLIFDEALASLDLLTQKQIITLLKELHTKLSLTYLFITHNHTLAQQFSTQIHYLESR